MKSELNEKNQNLIYSVVDNMGAEQSVKELLSLFMQRGQDPYGIKSLINSINFDPGSGKIKCVDYEEQYDILAARLDLGNYGPGQQIIDEVAYSAIDSIDQMRGQEDKYDIMMVCAEGLISDCYTEESLTGDLLRILGAAQQ